MNTQSMKRALQPRVDTLEGRLLLSTAGHVLHASHAQVQRELQRRDLTARERTPSPKESPLSTLRPSAVSFHAECPEARDEPSAALDQRRENGRGRFHPPEL